MFKELPSNLSWWQKVVIVLLGKYHSVSYTHYTFYYCEWKGTHYVYKIEENEGES